MRGSEWEHVLRICTVAVATGVGLASAHLAPPRHRPAPTLAPATIVVPTSATLPAPAPEPAGRSMLWQNQRELEAEAKAAPAAARAAQLPSYPPGTVQAIIVQAFAPYGPAAVAWGLRVARCESGYNPRALNPAGPYYGLFQFLMSTFRATPYGTGDIYDPAANAAAAAWKYAHGGAAAWGCR